MSQKLIQAEDLCYKMTDTKDHNDSTIPHDLEAECELLRSQSKEQIEKIETLHQEVHVFRNRAQVAERVQVEFQSEIECQQQQISDMKSSHAASITKLKENHAKLVKELESRVLSLETQLSEVHAKSASDKEELFKAKKELVMFQDQWEVATLKAELQEVQEEHADNRQACVQHQELNKLLLKEKADLVMELNNTREHLEMLDEKLKICKSDMTDQTETIEELRESLAVAQSELACLKAGPADAASRGNSLFAEVEDKRQAMLQKCSSLSKKYSEMKRDYSAKCDEISRLKLENLQIRRQWQEEEDQRDNRDVWLKDNYEIRIKELIKMVEDIKKEERPVFLNGDSKILSYVDQEIEKSRKEMAMLREEMEKRSSDRLNEAKALYLARSELLTFKAELMSLRAENIILRDKLLEANITDIPSPGKTIKRLNEALLSTNNDHGCSHLKDNSSDQNGDSNSIFDVSQHKRLTSSSPQVLSSSCSVPKSEIEVANNSRHNEESFPSEDVSQSKPAISSIEPPVSSLLCCPPKPNRLMMLDLTEKLQSENACTNIANKETESLQTAHQPHESSDSIDLQVGIVDLHSSENHHEFVSSSLLNLSPKRMQEGPKFEIETSAALPMQVEACANEAIAVYPNNCTESESPTAQFVHPEKLGGNLHDTHHDSAPRRSILAKLSRPSLIPIDQNAMSRKVRFAEETSPSCDALKSTESDSSSEISSKKRLSRMPPPKSYKTKFVVSRETVYQD